MQAYKTSFNLFGLLFVIIIAAGAPNKLTVKTEAGTDYQMDYLAPQQFKPQNRVTQQKKLGDIGPIDVQSAQKFLQSKLNNNVLVAGGIYDMKDVKLTYQAEYYYYNRKYNLDKQREQLPFCIVSPYHNFFSAVSWNMYLDTLQNQNYTNFQVIMTDDMSTDNSVDKILEMVEKDYPRLRNRLTIVKNRQYTEMMGNHDIGIRNYCKNGTIVAEVDGDDTLIGRQVLNLLNAVYQDHPNTWVIYTNFLMKFGQDRYAKFGNNKIPDSIYDNNSYRTSNRWMTSHLKTYKRQVYMKIPNQYFQRSPGKYYLFGADIFIMVAVVELSGKQHTRYLDELVYFYKMGASRCSARLNVVGEKIARMKTPFMPLQDLQSAARITPNYTAPAYTVAQYNQYINVAYKCVVELRQKINDPTYMQIIN